MIVEILDKEGKVSRSQNTLIVSVKRNRKEVEYYVKKIKQAGDPYLFTKEDVVYKNDDGELSEGRFYNLYTTSSLFTGA